MGRNAVDTEAGVSPECHLKHSGPGREPSQKRRKESLAVLPDGVVEEVVRTYLQKLYDGDLKKLAALAGMNQVTVADDLQRSGQ